jgi:hypothetical protein
MVHGQQNVKKTLSMIHCIPQFHTQHTGNAFGLSYINKNNNNTSRGGYSLSNSQQSLRFDHKLVDVGFMVKKVAMRHVFTEHVGFALSVYSTGVPYSYLNHLSLTANNLSN